MSDFELAKFNYYESSQMFHGSMMNIMGTRFDIIIIGKSQSESESIWFKVELELKRLNHIMNRFDKLSEASRVNLNASTSQVSVSDEMWQILNGCKSYHKKTCGLFDITLNDFTTVKLNEHEQSVKFTETNTSIDFGGYGKGYALKRIKEILIEHAVEHCYADFGNSSILALGHHPHGDAWKVNIDNPYEHEQIVDEIELKDVTLSISGNTPSYSGHIVIPDTGSRIKERKMVCVLSEDPLDAEVLSTVLMIANEREAEQIKQNFTIHKINKYRL